VQGAEEPGAASGGGAGRVRAPPGGGGDRLHAGDGAAAGARARQADGHQAQGGAAAPAELIEPLDVQNLQSKYFSLFFSNIVHLK
jgi:hypothetical protein